MRIALVHALKHSIVPIEASFARLWPDAELMNLLDDSLSADLARDGRLTDAMTERFLGVTPGNGKALGLDEKWAYNVIKAVGNYGEIFERNVGKGSPLKLERGLNDLWTTGGLMYSPPPR